MNQDVKKNHKSLKFQTPQKDIKKKKEIRTHYVDNLKKKAKNKTSKKKQKKQKANKTNETKHRKQNDVLCLM